MFPEDGRRRVSSGRCGGQCQRPGHDHVSSSAACTAVPRMSVHGWSSQGLVSESHMCEPDCALGIPLAEDQVLKSVAVLVDGIELSVPTPSDV